jgi:hypothetical protein
LSDTACRVDFQVSKADSLIWLDSVSLYEINATGLIMGLRSQCFSNPAITAQAFGLGSDTWRDVSGTRGIRGSIMLPPFLSRVLLKDSIGVVNRLVDKTNKTGLKRVMVVRQIGSGALKVDFDLTKKQFLTIDITDVRGALIFSNNRKVMNQGHYSEVLAIKPRLAAGIYFITVKGEDFVERQRVTVWK